MDKLTMAHEYAMQHLKNSGGKITMHSLCSFAWQYADAMQAEAEKRVNKERPDVLKEEWQPDWSQAPEWADWWAMDKNLEARWILSDGGDPYIGMCNKKWFSMGKFNSNLAPSFNYQGNWQDSLRKRPE